MPRTPDIELDSKCGSCPVAIQGDHSKITCNPCFYLQRGIKSSPNTIKPEIYVDSGVDTTEMNEMKEMQQTWLESTKEMIEGDNVRFEDGDEKVLKVVSNPVAGPLEFLQPDGTKKTSNGLKIEVLEDDNPKIKFWSITSKNLMQQIAAICINQKIGAEVAGSVFRVTAAGQGMQRKYFVKLLARPGQTQIQDKGVKWVVDTIQ